MKLPQMLGSSSPRLAPRFAELAGALRRAPAAWPSSILRLLTAELACVDRDPALGAAAGDVAFVEALAAFPVAPLLLPQAMAQCMNTQGYVPAAALLQAYGGTAVACCRVRGSNAGGGHARGVRRHSMPTRKTVASWSPSKRGSARPIVPATTGRRQPCNR